MPRAAPSTPAELRVHDAVELPTALHAPVLAHAERRDEYPVHVTRDAAQALAQIAILLDGADAAVVTDRQVHDRHGRALLSGLADAGVSAIVTVLPAGEATKSLESALRLWDWLARSQLARRDVLIAFGGGVIADLGGWVASGYMRGVPYLNVPTTLLAQVDGAVGGKVAVNHELAKNLLGAFYQPIGVVSDVGYLRTLGDRHLRAGLAEAIKKAVIASPAYLDFIEAHADALLARDLDALERLVAYASAIKTTLVARDPYERDLRRPLNFGHTIGHPLETVSGYGPLLHGEAVAFGMVVEARIARDRGLLAHATYERLVELLARVGLPTRAHQLPAPVRATEVVAAMEKVRLIRAGRLRYVLPVAIGETAIADDVSATQLRAALAACGLR